MKILTAIIVTAGPSLIYHVFVPDAIGPSYAVAFGCGLIGGIYVGWSAHHRKEMK